MSKRLYRPKGRAKKEKLTRVDKLEIVAVITASLLMLGWAGWEIKDSFWPANVDVEEETESETAETEPMSVPSLEEAAEKEIGSLSEANDWEKESETEPGSENWEEETVESELLSEAVTETMTEIETEAETEEYVTETTTESETETETEPKTKSETELETETNSKARNEEAVQEESTEAVTEPETQTEKESEKEEASRETKQTTAKVTGSAWKKDRERVLASKAKTEKPELESETETEAPSRYRYISNGILNIREQPDKGATRLGQCPSGEILDVLEYTEENPQWMKITYNGMTGYVSAAFVLKEDNPDYVEKTEK